jgi:GAF domain-containing protein
MDAQFAGTPAGFAQVARELAETGGILPTLDLLVTKATALLSCDWAAIVVAEQLSDKRARLAASNDEALARIIAAIAGRAGVSPGIDAFERREIVVCNDLATVAGDYPDYVRGMLEQTSVRAVLSVPLQLNDAILGVLTCYADRVGVFDERAVEMARVLGEHTVVAIEAARHEDRATNLELALLRSRTIGAAMGILIERFAIAPAEAFAWLRQISQDTNRNLGELAAALVERGTLPGLTEASGRPQAPHAIGEGQPVPDA